MSTQHMHAWVPTANHRTEPVSASASAGRTLRFLANVDPIDATAALKVCACACDTAVGWDVC